METLEQISKAIKFLSMDAVQKANCGHPGMPMGMSDIASVIWKQHIRHNPKNPRWFNRDRFVLSNGHGSMLLYSVLHLTGYDISIDDIKNFRQLHSKTPGHPEYDISLGIETTTGPLGQGLSNAVGMALAEKHLSARFNKSQHKVIDHFTYVFLGDGCLMEGISHEACSFAGTHQLGKLVCLYDQNNISIDGNIKEWFTDNTRLRFESYNWEVLEIDGHNFEDINKALIQAKSNLSQPTLICCKTDIGSGSPNKAGTEKVHGNPLGEDEILQTRQNLGWNHEPFVIPDKVYQNFDARGSGAKYEKEWESICSDYKKDFPKEYAELKRVIKGILPKEFSNKFEVFLKSCIKNTDNVATRKASEICLEFFCDQLPEMIGGSADLTGSNNTFTSSNTELLNNSPEGSHIYYGVREFGMTGITNGMLLHGGIRPYSGTFLVFMDYARNAVRLSALMKIPNIYVYTHDSIGLGEDGPTHQPIEHLVTLRATPNLNNWRPADLTETAIAWHSAISSTETPTSLILSRQGLPPIQRNNDQLQMIQKGGYRLLSNKKAKINIVATGSELHLAVEASEMLLQDDIQTNVISIPCLDIFKNQSSDYKDLVIDQDLPTLFVEALHPDSWGSIAKSNDKVHGIRTFGESAPGNLLMQEFRFTSKDIADLAKELLQ
tara:strand:+ start:14831 stop:16819 length:1989 start_codon:yes stop_codon:yes gene_type:complete